MPYFVSRQIYWGMDKEEGTVVEVAGGGLDYANPDMLVAKWVDLGEGKEFDDPREAVEAAIQVCEAWRASGETDAKVAFGHTGGSTLPFDPLSYEEARERAKETWEKLPKCDHCGNIMGKKTYGHHFSDGFPFCSESCADKDYADMVADDEEEVEDDA